ncbi:class I histocompatibility antigen, F10 alpha chain-like [Pipra filicauda]|uniref:Class I histocompatibility antigen, F10 alpha chain-like n=1 Tax=Pipra filicauda TaxID=649802 RepID=A0A7R5KUD3_9PASS|nr:class I histocompatibility antigen, F10 alpha chain-like [Pipra filicauda]
MAPALGLGALLALLGVLAVSGGQPKVLHSLRFLSVTMSEPGLGVPQYVAVGYLDGIPFQRYDSERGRAEPQTPWMAAGAEPGYWDGQTQIHRGNQHVAISNVETLRGRYNQSGGLHTLPGEREQYRCRVEHAGMPEPGIFAWEPESIWNSTPVLVTVSVGSAIIIIIIIGLIGFSVWKL